MDAHKFAVIEWRGDCLYHANDIVARFATEKKAQEWADKENEGDYAKKYVVRTIRYMRGYAPEK